MKKLSLISTVTFLIITVVTLSHADVPKLINYQGHLTDKGGNPLTGVYSITFTIYDDETDGNNLWSETQSSVAVKNGLFNILLGTATVGGIPYSVFPGADRWLGIAVESDSEMEPRQQLVSVPYAYKANDSDKLNGQSGSYYNELIGGGETDLHTHSLGDLGGIAGPDAPNGVLHVHYGTANTSDTNVPVSFSDSNYIVVITPHWHAVWECNAPPTCIKEKQPNWFKVHTSSGYYFDYIAIGY